MTDTDTQVVEELRQNYADWYMRERLARQQTEQLQSGSGALMQMKLLGIDPADLFGYDIASTAQDVVAIGLWLVAEAEWHLLHAEALLRSYGVAVLKD